MGGISIWQLLIILVIVLLIFGAKRLRNLGSDLGASVKGFRSAMREGEQDEQNKSEQGRIIDGQPTKEQERAFDAEVGKEKDRA